MNTASKVLSMQSNVFSPHTTLNGAQESHGISTKFSHPERSWRFILLSSTAMFLKYFIEDWETEKYYLAWNKRTKRPSIVENNTAESELLALHSRVPMSQKANFRREKLHYRRGRNTARLLWKVLPRQSLSYPMFLLQEWKYDGLKIEVKK